MQQDQQQIITQNNGHNLENSNILQNMEGQGDGQQ